MTSAEKRDRTKAILESMVDGKKKLGKQYHHYHYHHHHYHYHHHHYHHYHHHHYHYYLLQ